MKKSRIFIAAGTFVLAITAIFATKANKKFSSVSTAYIAPGFFLHGGSAILTTIHHNGLIQGKMFIYTTTSSGSVASGNLFTQSGSSGHVAYYR